jgi:hypothetical protein
MIVGPIQGLVVHRCLSRPAVHRQRRHHAAGLHRLVVLNVDRSGRLQPHDAAYILDAVALAVARSRSSATSRRDTPQVSRPWAWGTRSVDVVAVSDDGFEHAAPVRTRLVPKRAPAPIQEWRARPAGVMNLPRSHGAFRRDRPCGRSASYPQRDSGWPSPRLRCARLLVKQASSSLALCLEHPGGSSP